MYNNHKQILIDCERMKYPYAGLYYYCLHLAQNLNKIADTQHEEINFFLPKSAEKILDKQANNIQQSSLHKLLLPSLKKYDVWHATHQGSAYFPMRRKIPVVLTIHDINFMYDERKSLKKKKAYLKQLEQKIKRADHITAISQFTLNNLQQHISTNDTPTTVIYNGCNIQPLGALYAPAVVPPKSFLFTIGTIAAKKNFHVLPALLVGNNKNLVIAGITQSEPYKQKIIEEARRWKVEEKIIFTGAVNENDKQWYYKNCEAFVFPSLAEGFGLPVVEAMYFGKPVIISGLSSLPEIGGDVAYYFKSFDAENMRHVLNESLSHYSLTNPSGKIMQRAKSFNWMQSAQQYLNVYRSLY